VLQLLLKTILSAGVIALASEAAKRSVVLGALIVALPLTSMLAMVWLYADTRDMEKVARFALAIPAAVLPSLVFFFAFAWLAKYNYGFALTFAAATVCMLAGYGAYLAAMRVWGA